MVKNLHTSGKSTPDYIFSLIPASPSQERIQQEKMSPKKPNTNKNKDRERRLTAKSSSPSQQCQWSIFAWWVLLMSIYLWKVSSCSGRQQNLVIKGSAMYVLIKIFKIMYRQMNKNQILMMRTRRNTSQWIQCSAYSSILWISCYQWIDAISSSESIVAFFLTKNTFHVLSLLQFLPCSNSITLSLRERRW